MNKRPHYHFMGISGIGMSALADIACAQGYTVSGCDASSDCTTTPRLQAKGCTIFEGHHQDHLQDVDVLVYSTAITLENIERSFALHAGITMLHRSQMLAKLMQGHETVAVTGSHGKTTTTSLIGHIFVSANRDPNIITGGIMANLESNARSGKSNILIVEADESDRSLLNLSPTHALITNTDAEHLDVYRNLGEVQDTFCDFLGNVSAQGKAFICIDDLPTQALMARTTTALITYGLDEKAQVRGIITSTSCNSTTLTIIFNTRPVVEECTIEVPMGGTHHAQNAIGACAVAYHFGIPMELIAAGIASFRGVARRFEFKGLYNNAQIFDDYGHHPTELACVFSVAQKRAQNNLYIAFQPQRYTRTAALWDEFIRVLSTCPAKKLFIVDIYEASEKPITGITSTTLVEALHAIVPEKEIYYVPSYDALVLILQQLLAPGDLLLTLGAGKLYKVAEHLVEGSL